MALIVSRKQGETVDIDGGVATIKTESVTKTHVVISVTTKTHQQTVTMRAGGYRHRILENEYLLQEFYIRVVRVTGAYAKFAIFAPREVRIDFVAPSTKEVA